jgi:hypothetical protein
VAARQDAQPRPALGSGRVDVNVINEPAVTALQGGDWRVALAGPADVRVSNQPRVTVAGPTFLQAGRAYRVTWDGGQTEVVTVAALSGDGWVQVEAGGRGYWINLAVARAIEARQ